MGYVSAYAGDMISYITPREAKFLDRLFLKALVNTRFGRKEKERIEAGKRAGEDMVFTLEGRDIDRMDGAETLYQQTGLNFFGDNEFAFRSFSDTKEYNTPLSTLEKSRLFAPSDKILERLSSSIDKALIEIQRRCTPSRTKPNAIYENPDFRNGAWQLYEQFRTLVPELLLTKRDRRTIKRNIALLK